MHDFDESIGQNPSLHHLKFFTAKLVSATYRKYSILTTLITNKKSSNSQPKGC